MEKKIDEAVYAAIAMAMQEFTGNNVHDAEAGTITIKSHQTLWNAHALQMTVHP